VGVGSGYGEGGRCDCQYLSDLGRACVNGLSENLMNLLGD
jgi:hypothetical protein